MKNILRSLTLGGSILFGLVLIHISCGGRGGKPRQEEACMNAEKNKEFISVKIDGKLWMFLPRKPGNVLDVSYKSLSRQLSVKASAKDGSSIELSFHAVDQISIGRYPSTLNDNGIKSGIFYFPGGKSKIVEFASATYGIPVQENTIAITKVDRSKKDAYLIEGVFSGRLYPANGKYLVALQLTEGKFRLLYHPDSNHPQF